MCQHRFPVSGVKACFFPVTERTSFSWKFHVLYLAHKGRSPVSAVSQVPSTHNNMPTWQVLGWHVLNSLRSDLVDRTRKVRDKAIPGRKEGLVNFGTREKKVAASVGKS